MMTVPFQSSTTASMSPLTNAYVHPKQGRDMSGVGGPFNADNEVLSLRSVNTRKAMALFFKRGCGLLVKKSFDVIVSEMTVGLGRTWTDPLISIHSAKVSGANVITVRFRDPAGDFSQEFTIEEILGFAPSKPS